MLREISIFIDNKQGRLKAVTKVLAENGINIRAFNVQDRTDFGLMKMLVSDTDKCEDVLKAAGFACAIRSVAAALIEDKPGGIYSLFERLEIAGINVADACAFVKVPGNIAIMCIETENVLATEAALIAGGFSVIGEEELNF